MGRRPIPVASHVRRGTYRADRHGPPPALDAGGAAPDMPASLVGVAADTWASLAPLLAARGLLTLDDVLALERLCQCYAEVRELEGVLAAEGRTYTPEGGVGVVRPRPEVASLAEADRRLRQWLVEFGLTPAARNRVDVQPQTNSAADDYFR